MSNSLLILIGFFVAVALSYGAHELTHLIVARLAAPIEVTVLSWVPTRIAIDYPEDPPPTIVRRLIAIAPLLVGSLIAIVAVMSGVWQWLGQQEPYYFRRLVLFLWLLYAHVSPTDARSALWPDRSSHPRTV